MTADKIALRELLEKGSDAGFLREMIVTAVSQPRSPTVPIGRNCSASGPRG